MSRPQAPRRGGNRVISPCLSWSVRQANQSPPCLQSPARHAAEHQAGNDGHDPHAAGHPAKQRAGQIDDALADAAACQKLAGEDEQRHGDQDERLDAGDQVEEQRVKLIREVLEMNMPAVVAINEKYSGSPARAMRRRLRKPGW